MEQRTAFAAIALSGALFARVLWSPAIDAQPCAHPVEARAISGHTVAVDCKPRDTESAAVRGPARVLFGLPIELNCAGARTLESLAGIGPARAQQIVEERARRPFERVEDLLRVRGIGPKTLAGLRGAVAASPARMSPGDVDSEGCRPEVDPLALGALPGVVDEERI